MAAGGLAAVPLVIHLLSLRGYRREPWAAMRFLVAAQKKARRRLHFEQWLLLAMRTLIVLLIGLTLARPFSAKSSLLNVLGETRSDRVIIVDDSLSMHALRDDGHTSFEKARLVAAELIARADASDGVALIRGGAPAQSLVDGPTRDRQVLERLLDDGSCSSGMDDLHAAIRLASDMLMTDAATRGGRICYVLTDFTQSAMDIPLGAAFDKEAAADLPGIDKLVFINVGPQHRGNLAIISLRAKSQIVGAGIPARFEVELANERDETLERVEVEITVDGSTTTQAVLGPIMPRETAVGEFDLAFGRVGPHRIRARIKTSGSSLLESEDPLSQDDERYLVVEVSPPISVLAVDRAAPGPSRVEDLFFFTTALAPADSTMKSVSKARPFAIKRITQSRFEEEPLDNHDVVVLGNLRRLSRSAVERLEEFVRSGGGVMVFLGADVSAEAYNEFFAEGRGLIPFRLNRAVRHEESAALPRMQIADARHPATMDLTSNKSGGLERSLVRSHWSIEPSDSKTLRTLLRLSTGEPLAVSHSLGRGRVLWWLTSADMSWTNLPAKPDYVPLMINLTVFTAGDRQSELNLITGQPLVLRYPARLARHLASITDPAGTLRRSELESEATGVLLNYTETLAAGFYGVTVADVRRDAVVNYDTNDRDLTAATTDTVRRVFGPRATVVESPREVMAQTSTGTPREFAQILMFCLILAVVAETLAGACFGTRR